MPNPRAALAILLTFLLAAAAFAARHQRTTTTITSVPYIITKPGLYRLGRDLNYPGKAPGDTAELRSMIEIAAPDVTLDFHDHTLAGPEDPHTEIFGVYSWEQENLVIKNGRITRCYVGIYLHGAGAAGDPRNSNHRIENMEISHDYHVGIFLESARSSTVQGCRISFIGPSQRIPFSCGIVATGDGIVLSHNLISDVTPSAGDAYGIFCNGSLGVFEVDNILSDCQFAISAGKYRGNLTNGSKVPFSGGIDAGGNN